MADKNHTIQGVVVTSFDGSGVQGLKVEAWDKDRQIDDLLGGATTDEDGRFEITFDDSYRDELLELRRPDVYFRVFRNGQLLLSTEESFNWNVSRWPMPVSLTVNMMPPPLLEVSAASLSLGMRGDDVRRVQQAVRALGRELPPGEDGTLGAGSVAVLKALQADFGLPPSGAVDAATVGAINARLARLATDPRVVRGSVRGADGTPLTEGFVQVFAQVARGEQAVGKAQLDAVDGSYEISYRPPAEGKGRVDLRVAVMNGRGVVETEPSGASVLNDAGPLEVVNFVLSGGATRPLSEFELLTADLKPLLGTRDVAELDEQAVGLLAVRSGREPEQIASLVRAHRLERETRTPDTTTPAPVFYGLLRRQLPADAAALHAAHPSVRSDALKAAVAQGLIPEEVGGKKVEEHLGGFAPAPGEGLRTLLGGLLDDDKLKAFTGAFAKDGQNPDAFWREIESDPDFADRAPELKFTVQLAALTQNHVPLVNAVKAMPDIREAADLVRLTEERWTSLVRDQGVGVPPDTPGAGAEDKALNYARRLARQVEAKFPTLFFAARLDEASQDDSRVAAFLRGQPSYDLMKTNPAAAQDLTPPERGRLADLQRVYRVVSGATASSPRMSNAEESFALARSGVRSASQIARQDRDDFARRHREVFSEERAREVHGQAARTNAVALALFGENGTGLNRVGLRALPKLDTESMKVRARTVANLIPDWEGLFGGSDFCACRECGSAHGPAAYFVDILNFLDERKVDEGSQRSVKDALFDRRPDLGDIELSCENTNTVLPFVDLVNEILENAVAPPAEFEPFDLDPALEADLDREAVSPELAAAFDPRLVPGARVETLEGGERWRVWDEPFAYSVVKAGDALNVTARSRQTTGTTDERRAAPQYRNQAAYEELKRAVFPPTLPFDSDAEEAKVFLLHLGVTRRDLIETLRLGAAPFDSSSDVLIRLAAERFGLSGAEREIVVGAATNPPEEFWGSATVADLSTVRELLDRSGLDFAELEAALGTWFVNPTKSLTISAEPVDTCDTTKLRVEGFTEDVLSRTHRFLRLWRKLGWTMPEVDKALRAFAPASDPDTPALTDEILIRLGHLATLRSRLQISVTQTLALWGPIDTSEPESLYRGLFDNPAVFNPPLEVFRLEPDGKELAHKDEPLVSHASAIQAVFRLTPEGFSILAAQTDGRLTLGNLSHLYRHALLARHLGVSIEDLLTAAGLTGIEPFDARRTQDTLLFVEVVKDILDSGFGLAQLDYLLRHVSDESATFVPTEASLAQTLTDVRSGLLSVDAPSGVERERLRESEAVDRVAAALSLPPDVTAILLGRVNHGGLSALQMFMSLSAVGDEVLPLTRGNAGPQFGTLEKLLKVAAVIQALELPGSLVEWLFRETAVTDASWLASAPDPPAAAVPFRSWFPLVQLRQVRRELRVEEAALEAILGALGAVALAADDAERLAARNTFIGALTTWLGWPQADLLTLLGDADDLTDLGLFEARVPEDYKGLDLLLRLNRAMSLLKRLGVTADKADEWCGDSLGREDAKAIRSAAKAKHDTRDWLKVAPPLQNVLRDRQREALVSYLVARPELWAATEAAPGGGADKEDAALHAHFLIDVEMSSCQLTSRLKQAAGSVQLFTQRCLLGLEPEVRTGDDGKWQQWEWMKNFRVWEANRKIWLYPENFIQAELRDDKTPFFRELEDELLQADLDNAAAERALRHYLEKLNQVANLQIVGVYEEDEDETLHVFGRTFNAPHVYYYRRRGGASRRWTPWELVELDIEGDHLIPVVWNRKLMLVWPVFAEKAEAAQVVVPEPKGTIKSPGRFWEIQLAWSEYRNGAWAAKNLSSPTALKSFPGGQILFGAPTAEPTRLGVIFRKNDDDLNDIDRPVGGGDGPGDGDDGDPGGGAPPDGGTTHEEPPRSRLLSRVLFSFKAFATDDELKVRGYLRRDYPSPNASSEDMQVACVFGEFRFAGCQKIVSTAHVGQMGGLHFPLAPTGTKFDRMWFTQTGQSLSLFDRIFTARPLSVNLRDAFSVNAPASVVGDAGPALAEKFVIPVLGQTPTPFRLLAPHQDFQFVCDRPSFYMDGRRAFVITSTGSSGRIRRPDLGQWGVGDLGGAGLNTFFRRGLDGPNGNGAPAAPAFEAATMTVLVPTAGGQRRARTVVLPSLESTASLQPLVPRFFTTRRYTFANFHHPFLCDFEKELNRGGLPALLSLPTQSRRGRQSFEDTYAPVPEPRVSDEYPADEVEFRTDGAYEIYNWELFFHIPLLIAERLAANQRFAEAQRWFHFIFDPTGASGGSAPQRYWRTRPFHERMKEGYEAESVEAIEKMVAAGLSDELRVAVEVWRSNPFSPHAVARLRTTAYQKAVVMRYLDNLIAWGDQLFRRETLESLNEAAQLYVLAAEILGRRPEVIERDLRPAVRTFNTLDRRPGGLGNALEQIELLVSDAGELTTPEDSEPPPDPPSDTVLFFCVPENGALLGYWDTVADRLFKLRNCMDMEGRVRQLPLFEPPIDPALLVRARAAGLSIAEVLNDMNAALPAYRFSVMAQKAGELVGDVRNLGSALLSVLEKRDAEALSRLRSGHELRLLDAVREVRVKQVEEAKANIEGLDKSRELAQARKAFFEGREDRSAGEEKSLSHLKLSLLSMKVSAGMRKLAFILHKTPVLKIGSPTTAGIETGGTHLGNSVLTAASVLDVGASILSVSSQVEGRKADFDRRSEEWKHQADLATVELKQIEQQKVAAEIRLAVAERELRNHDLQVENAREADRFLRDKFTDADLYQYMIGRVSSIYFQSYQLAYELAKRAELCMQHELGLDYGETAFIRFGYWDSLKKGLLAGEHLAFDLKRLEVAYLDGNAREYELTKHVSLVSLAPHQFLALKEMRECVFDLPEWLFDLDTPGHFMRRLKMVSLTIPCVTGPYTTIHCKLQLTGSSYRKSRIPGQTYERTRTPEGAPAPDDRFIDVRKVVQEIVTSTGQNDSGLFEPAMRDERYLPFEGAGAISSWRLELPNDFQTFDYDTISDVILHLRYTARDGNEALRGAAAQSVTRLFADLNSRPLLRLFSLRHEFPSEWHRFFTGPAAQPPAVNKLTVNLAATRFPFFVQNRQIDIKVATVEARMKTPSNVGIAPGAAPPALTGPTFTGQAGPGPWTFATDAEPKDVEDVFVIFEYGARPRNT
jgi:peptidoglycan hydrolase-like protein with peptidoglycan-binding domain